MVSNRRFNNSNNDPSSRNEIYNSKTNLTNTVQYGTNMMTHMCDELKEVCKQKTKVIDYKALE